MRTLKVFHSALTVSGILPSSSNSSDGEYSRAFDDVASVVILWVRFPAARLQDSEVNAAAIDVLPPEAQAAVPDAGSAATTSLVPVEDTPYPNGSSAPTVSHVAVPGGHAATIAALTPEVNSLDQDGNLRASADRLGNVRWLFPGGRYLKLLIRINVRVLQR